MPRDVPSPTAEGVLIRRARQRRRPKISMSEAAAAAGISTDNWGHIERGYQSTGRGQPPRAVTPPADTLAHMAHAINITPEELVAIDREDAAEALRDLLRQEPVPALVGESTHSTGLTAARDALNTLRERAVSEDRSLGEMLVEAGLAAPDELRIPDALVDPIIEEIATSSMSEETKTKLIKLHLDNRAQRFEEKRLNRKKPGS